MRVLKSRNALKMGAAAAVAIAACLSALTLTGCEGTNGADGATNGAGTSASADEPVPASQAFGNKSVWLQYNDEQPGKDTGIQRILSFDGNGNVTVYDVDYIWMNNGSDYESLTFGDLDGLSDDEIIELARKKSRERFDATKQAAIDETEASIESDSNSDYAVNEREGQQVNEAAEYQEPEAVPYTLKIDTDDTGNNARLETLSFEYDSLNSSHFYSGSHIGSSPDRYADEKLYEACAVDIELYQPISTYSTVYDTAFGGFAKLATVVDEPNALVGFTWDAPGAEGIEVD